MKEKIRKALEYIQRAKANPDQFGEDPENDAANIYADNIEEYNAIWREIEKEVATA